MAAQVKQSEPQGCTCQFRTFLNHGDLKSCEMCLQSRFDKAEADTVDDNNVEAKNAENDFKQTGSGPNNSNNNNNNNNSNNSNNKPHMNANNNNNNNRPFFSIHDNPLYPHIVLVLVLVLV